METKRQVAGYFRVSLARDNMHAPGLYEDEIRRYCSCKKLNLAKLYSDIDYSAFRGAKPRPSLEELIARRQEYDSIVIPKLSRFGRSMKELVRLFDLFDSDGIPLVFLDMNLDTSTSQGRLLRHILAAFAEYESDVKADYTRANHRRIRAEGRPWGIPPFGYQRGPEPNTWILDPDRAGVVRAIFERYVAGASGNAIAGELNELGLRTTRGNRWKSQLIGKMLDNPAYAALSLIDDDLVAAQWEAIVDPATWEAVRARRAADPRRVHNLGRTKPRSPYLLSGLMWCGQCGRRMTHTKASRDGRGVYHCAGSMWATWDACLNARVPEDLADDSVSERFLERCSFTILTGTGARGGRPRTLWAEASLPERKRLLNLVVARVVVTPLDIDIPRSQYRTRLRHDLSIEWKAEVAEGAEVAVVAEAPTPAPPRELKFKDGRYQMLRSAELRQLIETQATGVGPTPSAKGKSWAQWRAERLRARLDNLTH